MVAECSPHVKVPTAPFFGRRQLHVPGAYEVAERIPHGLTDRDDQRLIGDASNLDVNRVDDKHGPEQCKGGTVESSSLTGAGAGKGIKS
jgi:hypothetical protein